MSPKKNNAQEIRQKILSFLEKGYSKSQLARELEVSRSSLIKIIDNPEFSPSNALLTRAELNLNWLEKSHGHELLDTLTLIYFQNQNVLKYFQDFIDKTEDATGFHVGYHGVTLGGPIGFIMFNTPGSDPITEIMGSNPFPHHGFGRTETLLIGTTARYTGNKDEAMKFFNKHKNPRIYLKFFQNYNFSSVQDIKLIQKLFQSNKFQDDVFILESGVTAGRYDYFFLLIAKDEDSYVQLLTGSDGVYAITGKSLTDSITMPVVRPVFEENSYNLSFTKKEIRRKQWLIP